MRTNTAISIVALAALGMTFAPVALAKGGEDNPAIVKIDESGNDVDVTSLPAVKIDASQNDVDANVTNEVEIKNSSGAALRVDTGAATRIPYTVIASDFSNDNGIIQGLSVPEGHIFVIEYATASASCFPACDGIFSARIEFTTGGSPGRAYLPTQARALSPTGHSEYVISENVKLYADPDSTATFFIFAAPDTVELNGSVALSGYLVPVDEPSLAP